MEAPKVRYEIIYNGKNITANILPHVINFSYSDKSKGETDELQLLLEDTEKLWQNEWYPAKGDTITASIIDVTGTLLCGTFTVDEVTGSGAMEGDTITIKGIAAGINKKIRTKKSYAHESKTLREIANRIAANHGFTVEGKINEVRIDRVTQYRETDLKFLQRLAYEFGYTFSIRDKKLVFTNVFDLEKKSSALTILRSEITGWAITDKTSETYKSAKLSYHNPKSKKLITHQHTESEASYQGAKVDTLELKTKVENQQQAEIKSRVALYRANSLQQEGTIEMPGNIYAVAGNNCEFQGAGMFSGLYYIDAATHNVDKDAGYTISISVKRVGLVEKSKQKS